MLLALESLLTGKGWTCVCSVTKAYSGEEALCKVLGEDFAVILLDISMPDMDGFETAKVIHSHPRSACTPIIFTTAYYNDDGYCLKGYQNSAVDYLLMPVIPQILQAKVSVFVKLAKKRLELQRKTEQLESIISLRHGTTKICAGSISSSKGWSESVGARNDGGRQESSRHQYEAGSSWLKQTKTTNNGFNNLHGESLDGRQGRTAG